MVCGWSGARGGGAWDDVKGRGIREREGREGKKGGERKGGRRSASQSQVGWPGEVQLASPSGRGPDCPPLPLLLLMVRGDTSSFYPGSLSGQTCDRENKGRMQKLTHLLPSPPTHCLHLQLLRTGTLLPSFQIHKWCWQMYKLTEFFFLCNDYKVTKADTNSRIYSH